MNDENNKETKGDSVKSEKKARSVPKLVIGVFAVIIIILIIGLVVFGIGIYKLNWNDNFTRTISEYIPYPAAMVGNSSVSYSEVQNELTMLDHYYNFQEELDPSLADSRPTDNFLKKGVTTRKTRELFLAEAAANYGLTVAQEEIDNEFNIIMSQTSGINEVETALADLYNWTVNDFKEKVIKPRIIQEKVGVYIALDEEINKDQKLHAEEALSALNGDKTFDEVALEYSEDITASTGGDLGFFRRGDTYPEFESAVIALEPGEVSGIVKSRLGFHIIKLLEKISADTEADEQFHAAHILIKSKPLENWIVESLSDGKVKVFISGYEWKDECALILEKTETCENNELFNWVSSLGEVAPETINTNTESAE
ncbi:peptidylprolyl isomerase [Patescibacteria group bacterium]|nr:peptidylprolyl isomerase [Patescibacteria group bacterium]MBU0964158.1 peptidylprolyl isomerase [Patescibacteria group bacterium]